jgi:hypothetical protein
MMYYNHEKITNGSKMSGGSDFRGRFTSDKCGYYFKMAAAIVVFAFAVIQVVLLVCLFFDLIDVSSYGIQLYTFYAIVTIALNIHASALYCRMRDRPYKSRKLQKKHREYGFVLGFWTVAYMLKIIIGFA